ncbi:family 43 glycosylhydrolase [Pedobacter sp. HMF7647]|uniref:Family 43 glycosylhydrolase n=1 Tax=Hufsiella arboris TaxID=2695275 RepID=A0A7K1Y8S7_9SPHI|nr:glycoside hydrolase family 43 protein [Hufsiella arboris]MXV50996.1 family 43 glycosylhydrolase [Hufsiella arboris]
MHRIRYFFILLMIVLFASSGKARSTIFSDTIRLADPTIFLDKGTYYLYGTNSPKGFLVYKSNDLKNWSGPVGKTQGHALYIGDSFGTKGFWAPQIFKSADKYYMAYTADEQIAIAESNSPLGPFKQKIKKPLSGSGKQIDPFIFKDSDGKLYLYHVRLTNGNRIFVAQLKNDLSDIDSTTVRECIAGDEPWENTAGTNWPVTEGPTVLKHNNLYYLFYSANDFRNIDYAVGYATSRSPFGPWKKFAGNPVISRVNIHQNGTGHGDFFKDKNGHLKYVFHTHYSDKTVSPRLTAIIDAKWSSTKQDADVLMIAPESFYFLKNERQAK